MDLEGGVNRTDLLNVFPELCKTPSTLENLTLPDLYLLFPTTLSKGGGGGEGVRAPPTDS